MSQLNDIQQLISAGKHSEALALTEEISVEDLSAEELARFHLLAGEVKVVLGRYDHDHLDKAIEFYRRTHYHDYFAHAKFLKGWQLQALGLHEDAKEPLLESYTAFLRVDSFNEAARSLNRLSIITFQSGEVPASLDALDKSMKYYGKAGNRLKAEELRVNKASVLFMSGSLRSAIAEFSALTQCCKDFPIRTQIIYRSTFAMATALRGDIVEADALLSLAANKISKYEREFANLLEYRGWIGLLKEDLMAAKSDLLEGLVKALHLAPESALISQIKRLLGDVYFAQEQYDQARVYTDEALEVARKINERAEIAACYRLYAQLSTHDNKAEQARDWFAKAIDLFNMIASRYELAVTRYLAGISGLYPDAESTALLHMALDYFTSEEVTPYIKKVSSALDCMKKAGRLKPTRPAADAELPVIITRNKAMTKILEFAANIAPSEMTVLLTGDTGTGKDLMARHIHYHSGRAGKFVSVNAAAIPRDMVESELFGHTRGAFTGASADRKGLLAEAENGTFYLNEIADTDIAFQAKLLEVLESKRVRRLGENKENRVAFRLIAATNHNLQEMVRKNQFRADLYHRLNEIPIALPPLAKRLDDIPPLLIHALSLSNGKKEIDIRGAAFKKLCQRLEGHDWSGNIRQFKADVQRLYMEAGCDLDRMSELVGEPATMTREELLAALEAANWNRREVARVFSVSEGTIRYRMKKFDIAEEILLP